MASPIDDLLRLLSGITPGVTASAAGYLARFSLVCAPLLFLRLLERTRVARAAVATVEESAKETARPQNQRNAIFATTARVLNGERLWPLPAFALTLPVAVQHSVHQRIAVTAASGRN